MLRGERRKPFSCRISPATADFLTRVPGMSKGQKIDRLVTLVLTMQKAIDEALQIIKR